MKKPEYWQESIDYLSNIDAILRELINKYSQSTLTTHGDALETLMRSIVGQQISVKAAASVWHKIIDLLDEIKPDNVLLAGFENLRSCGLSKQKTQYILNIAEHFKSHNINDESYWNDREFSNIYDELITIKGIGPWTAEMFGMFYLLERDIFPLKDLGILKAINQLYCVDGIPLQIDQVVAISDRWKPYRTVASWYLWRSIDNEAVLY
jgi:DNA-3-methyladenine glycosylase II